MFLEYVAIGLGILSFLISGLALSLAVGSDRRMKALSNLEFHEKLAIMAHHLRTIGQDPSPLRAEQIRNHLAAATSLQLYATKTKQEQMIRDYVIPLVQGCLSDKMEPGVPTTVRDIIDIALSYGIEPAVLQDLRQRVRGLDHNQQPQT